jgi:hypothetical protein
VAGGGHRTDHLAGGFLAVHAGPWLEVRIRIIQLIPLVVAVDPDPVHLATVLNLLFADDRNVVFGTAGDGTGIAADAGVEIDRHAPFVARVWVLRVERVAVRRLEFILG